MAVSTLDLGTALRFQDSDAVSTYQGAGSLINNILPNVYIAGGVVIFFMIILGGFTIIANAGNPDKIKEGGKTITSAIIGLLVLFGSYWIIQIIQVVTGVNILSD